MDAVEAITAAGHINLLETFAERIAERCLADPRLTAMRVRIEKLGAWTRSRRRDLPHAAGKSVKPVVVKLGWKPGRDGPAQNLLSLVCRAERPVIIVPGGGPYADAVRASQRELGFSDEAARDMAILAMNRWAWRWFRSSPGGWLRRRRWPPCERR